jgi:TetR/AcrR family fatty acid metabolism transcriptional regulator
MAYRTTPKMAERKDARRRTLLDAATRLFGRKGYHATTVPMIVAKADSSTGSFYFYFRNKEDVFAAALESLGERIGTAVEEAIRAAPGPLEQMRAAVEGLVGFLARNPAEARILIVESSGLGARLEQIRRKVIASHARGVEQALAHLQGRLAPLDPAIAARCWVGAVYEAVYHWLELRAAKRARPETLAREIAAFNLRGIGAEPKLLLDSRL